MINSDLLPTDIQPTDKEFIKGLGVIFGEFLDDDPIFCEAKLSEVWKKKRLTI